VQGLMREVREETGLIVGVAELLLVENIPDLRQLTLTYHCKGVEGVFLANDEVAGIGYFDLDSLPELSRRELATIDKCLERLNQVK
jgi:ADP-ribose pyrophosphatase YjhB (NUDIX family)